MGFHRNLVNRDLHAPTRFLVSSTSALTASQGVIFTGHDGVNPRVALATNAVPSSSPILGIVEEDIEANGTGYVTTFGILSGVTVTNTPATNDYVYINSSGVLTSLGSAVLPAAGDQLVGFYLRNDTVFVIGAISGAPGTGTGGGGGTATPTVVEEFRGLFSPNSGAYPTHNLPALHLGDYWIVSENSGDEANIIDPVFYGLEVGDVIYLGRVDDGTPFTGADFFINRSFGDRENLANILENGAVDAEPNNSGSTIGFRNLLNGGGEDDVNLFTFNDEFDVTVTTVTDGDDTTTISRGNLVTKDDVADADVLFLDDGTGISIDRTDGSISVDDLSVFTDATIGLPDSIPSATPSTAPNGKPHLQVNSSDDGVEFVAAPLGTIDSSNTINEIYGSVIRSFETDANGARIVLANFSPGVSSSSWSAKSGRTSLHWNEDNSGITFNIDNDIAIPNEFIVSTGAIDITRTGQVALAETADGSTAVVVGGALTSIGTGIIEDNDSSIDGTTFGLEIELVDNDTPAITHSITVGNTLSYLNPRYLTTIPNPTPVHFNSPISNFIYNFRDHNGSTSSSGVVATTANLILTASDSSTRTIALGLTDFAGSTGNNSVTLTGTDRVFHDDTLSTIEGDITLTRPSTIDSGTPSITPTLNDVSRSISDYFYYPIFVSIVPHEVVPTASDIDLINDILGANEPPVYPFNQVLPDTPSVVPPERTYDIYIIIEEDVSPRFINFETKLELQAPTNTSSIELGDTGHTKTYNLYKLQEGIGPNVSGINLEIED